MVVYDITNRKSFASVSSWVKDLREQSDKDVMLMVVGNKTDLEHLRAVSTEEGTKFAENQGVLFMETSAQSGANVEAAFSELLSRVMDMKRSAGVLVNVDKGVGAAHDEQDDQLQQGTGKGGYAAVGSGDGGLRSGVKLQVPPQEAADWKKSCCS